MNVLLLFTNGTVCRLPTVNLLIQFVHVLQQLLIIIFYYAAILLARTVFVMHTILFHYTMSNTHRTYSLYAGDCYIMLYAELHSHLLPVVLPPFTLQYAVRQ